MSNTNTRLSSASYLGSQPAAFCSKKFESVNGNAPGRALALNKGLLGEIKYIYKIKILKGHYSINYLMNNKTK